MRTADNSIVADHTLLQDVEANDHHDQTETIRILVNSLSIAPGSYDYEVSLSTSNHKTIRAILRGSKNVAMQGHAGNSVVGTDSSAESTSIGIQPYGAGGYLTSYMGAYSRLHGDARLSYSSTFGTYIALSDVFIDGDKAVFRFYNGHPYVNQNLKVYGVAVVK